MNQQNYASFEASKRLVDAGIALETDMIWHGAHGFRELRPTSNPGAIGVNYPAPSMAEVWRELPERIDDYELCLFKLPNGSQAGYIRENIILHPFKFSLNPTDALIDLLIWVRKEAK